MARGCGHDAQLVEQEWETDLVRLAREEHGTVADTERTLLLLTLSIDFGDGPCLNGVGLCLVGRGGDSVGGVDVGAQRARRLWWLCGV